MVTQRGEKYRIVIFFIDCIIKIYPSGRTVYVSLSTIQPLSANTQWNTEVSATNSRFIEHRQVDGSKSTSPGTGNGEGSLF